MKTIILRAHAEFVEIVNMVHRVGWRSAHFEKMCKELFSTHASTCRCRIVPGIPTK